MTDHIDELLANAGLSKQRLDQIRRLRDHSDSIKEGRSSGRFASRAKAFGHLRVIGIDQSGARLLVDDFNTITNKGFEILSRVWSGQFGGGTYADNYQPSIISIGNTSHGSSIETQTAMATAAGPNRLVSGVGGLNAVTTATVGTSGCKFEFILGTSQGNGITFTEAGLFPKNVEGSATGSGGMIAYKTYVGLPKSITLSLLYSWEFTFSEA